MNNLEENKKLYFIVNFVVTAIIAMIVFPGLDFLWDKFISKKTFEYSYADHIIEPVVFALIYSVLIILFQKKKKEK